MNGLVNDLVNFAANPANLPASENTWWATSSEMSVTKTTDLTYPVRQ